MANAGLRGEMHDRDRHLIAKERRACVGVGQIVDNVLAVSYAVKGRTVIALMTIHADGSLSGSWLRRTDRGAKGTETWTKKT